MPIQSVKPQERRRFARVKLVVGGRYMLENKKEYPCRTIDVSPGGLYVSAPVKGAVDERVVFYFEDFGRLEGKVVRLTEIGFAVILTHAANKRERLADLLTWKINCDDKSTPVNRRHKRIIPKRRHTDLILPDGRSVSMQIANVSISGVGLISENIPPLETRVDIGRRSGKVVRHFENGFAVEFLRLIPIEEFDEDIEL